MFNRPKHQENEYSKFDELSLEELEELLQKDFMSDDDNLDIDKTVYITEVIKRKRIENGSWDLRSTKELWNDFNKYYRSDNGSDGSLYDFDDISLEDDVKELESIKDTTPFKPIEHSQKRRASRLVRLMVAVISIVCVLFVGTLTANAFGINIFDTIMSWSTEVFGFGNPNEQTDDHIDIDYETAEIIERVQQYGVKSKVVPLWYPDGFQHNYIEISETPQTTTFRIQYTDNNNNNEIVIKYLIIPKQDSSELDTSVYEKDNSEYSTYTVNGRSHFIASNNARTHIVWHAENCECSIIGDFSLEEAEKMIDSIYWSD